MTWAKEFIIYQASITRGDGCCQAEGGILSGVFSLRDSGGSREVPTGQVEFSFGVHWGKNLSMIGVWWGHGELLPETASQQCCVDWGRGAADLESGHCESWGDDFKVFLWPEGSSMIMETFCIRNWSQSSLSYLYYILKINLQIMFSDPSVMIKPPFRPERGGKKSWIRPCPGVFWW